MPGYVINSKHVLFMHVPKAGGSSVEAALKRQGQQFLHDKSFHAADRFSAASAQHWHLEIIARLFPMALFDIRFAVVRHPVDRLVSEFKFRRGLKPWARAATRAPGLPPEPESFEPWLEDALQHAQEHPFLYDNHLRPQVDFIGPGIEVFHLECGLAPVVARLSEALDCPVTLPKRRKQVSSGPDVTPSRESIDKIHKAYAMDFDALGYDARPSRL